MRTAITVLLFVFTISTHALEWKSELFHCTANLPGGAGWQEVEAPTVPGLTTLVVMQNTGRQAAFAINVVDKVPGTSLSEPAVRQTLENLMRQSSYQFVGLSTVKVGGLDWLQYPVRSGSGAQQVAGVIRFASAGGYTFGITMLRGGGKDAASDLELQQAAASFRALPASMSAIPTAQIQTGQTMTPKPMAAAPAAPPSGIGSKNDGKPVPVAGDPTGEPAADNSWNSRLIWYAGAGLVVLLVLFQIIGGGKSGKR